jgi:hypothetical protein
MSANLTQMPFQIWQTGDERQQVLLKNMNNMTPTKSLEEIETPEDLLQQHE